MKFPSAATLFATALLLTSVAAPYAHASDWQEDGGKQPAAAPPAENPTDSGDQPRKKKRMKMQTGRIEANDADLNAQKGKMGADEDPLKGKADSDGNGLQGGAQDDGGGLTPMRPQ